MDKMAVVLRRFVCVIGCVLFAVSSFAATRTWDGSSSALWSDPANWVENTTPSPGDDLVFPAGAANLTNTSDIGSFSYASLTVSGAGYVINGTGNGGGFGLNTVNGVTITAPVTLNVQITLNVDQTWNLDADVTFGKRVTVFGQNLVVDINNATATFAGGISDPQNGGSITFTGNGTAVLNGTPLSSFGKPITINGPTVAIVGDTFTSPFTLTTGTFGIANNGSAGATTINGGTFRTGLQGTSGGNSGAFTLAPGAQFVPDTTGDPKTLNVTGTVTLGGALTVTSSNHPGGTQFTLINNDGTDAVVGTFAGLPEGATFNSGQTWTITYAGGTGNDVIITAQATGAGAATAGITSDDNPSESGDCVTFTATVTVGGPAPEGFVQFYDGATLLGTSALTGNTATLSVCNLTIGSHSITARYLGDDNYAEATSGVFTQTVAAAEVEPVPALDPAMLALLAVGLGVAAVVAMARR